LGKVASTHLKPDVQKFNAEGFLHEAKTGGETRMNFERLFAMRAAVAHKEKAQLGGLDQALALVIGIVALGVTLVVGNVLFAQLNTINTNSLGNNSNATASIGTAFSQLSTSQGIITLVIVVALLGLALAYLLGAFAGNRR